MSADYKDILQFVAGIISFCAYIPLAIAIMRNTARQSFAAFFLWSLLDGISMAGSFLEGGNFWLALANVCGTLTISGLLLYKRQVEWAAPEWITSALVLACLMIWYVTNNTGAIVSGGLAVLMASIPQMAHTRRSPRDTPVGIYLIWLAANVLSFIAGKAWTIDERFYATCSIALCIGILAFALVPALQQKRASAGRNKS